MRTYNLVIGNACERRRVVRIKEIVRIMYSLGSFVSVDMIKEELEVSKRTIQYDLNIISSIDEENGFQLISQRGLGYKIIVFNHKKFEKYIKYDVEESLLQLDSTIAGYLLLNDRFVTKQELTDLFLVSSSTVLSHVDIIKSHLREVGLELERKPQLGWRVLIQWDNRISLLIKVFGPDNSWLSNQIDKKVKKEEVEKFTNLLFTLVSNNNLEIIHGSFEILKEWVSMYLLYKIYNKKKSINQTIEMKDKEATDFRHILNQIVDQLFVEMDWPYEVKHVNDLKNILKNSIRESHSQVIKNDQVEEITQNYLKELDRKHNSNFYNNSDFVDRLITHVSLLVEKVIEDNTTVDRLKNEYRELLINEIVFKYPTMFSFSLEYSDLIEDYYEIEIDNYERALIASYFVVLKEQEEHKKLNQYERIAVVCGTGGGSSLFIKMKIKNIFHHATIETFSFIDILKIEKFQPDLIFTIKELQTDFNVPTLIIKEFINDEELLKIEQQLKQNIVTEDIPHYSDLFDQFFSKIAWKKTKIATNYISEVEKMCEELVKKEYANEDFPELVLERESYMSTVYLNGIAMPHPITTSAKKNIVSVNILENDCLGEEGKEVSIIFLICLNKKGYGLMKNIAQELYNIMTDRVLVSELKRSKSFEEFMEVMKRRK